MPVTDDFVVHRVFESLSLEYKQLKVFYSTLREKWSIDEKSFACVQEEDMLSKGELRKLFDYHCTR